MVFFQHRDTEMGSYTEGAEITQHITIRRNHSYDVFLLSVSDAGFPDTYLETAFK